MIQYMIPYLDDIIKAVHKVCLKFQLGNIDKFRKGFDKAKETVINDQDEG